MVRSSVVVRRGAVLATGIAVVGMAVFVYGRQQTPTGGGQRESRPNTYTVARRDFVRSVRLNGTVEAVQFTTIAAPRLAGPTSNSLIITKLVAAGSTVNQGDLIVEFDRQDQIKNALDKRAELHDLEQQIAKREAQERAARAHDDSEITLGESAIGRAQLEMVKNEMLPKINAEKNTQALEQARVTLEQLKATYQLKRQAAEADLRILQIRRDRAAQAERQAAGNAERMAIHAPIGGMVVVKTIWKGNNMAVVQEGEEVRAGVPVVDIVNPSAMRVRARVNQADINDLQVGQTVRIGLDAYPELFFDGRVAQISPLGVTSTMSAECPHVRRAHQRGRLTSQPDAGPDGVARRDAGAVAGRARRAEGRSSHRRRGDIRAGRAWRRVRRAAGHRERRQRARSDARVRPRRRGGHRAKRAVCVSTDPMRARLATIVRRPRNFVAAILVVGVLAAGAYAAGREHRHSRSADRGRHQRQFVDTLEIRGEIRPLKSIVLSSPMQSGELQILKLAKNGSMVKPGDVVVEFDPSTLNRTIQEKQSELKQADAEIEQAQAQTRIGRRTERDRGDEGRLRHRARQARCRQG